MKKKQTKIGLSVFKITKHFCCYLQLRSQVFQTIIQKNTKPNHQIRISSKFYFLIGKLRFFFNFPSIFFSFFAFYPTKIKLGKENLCSYGVFLLIKFSLNLCRIERGICQIISALAISCMLKKASVNQSSHVSSSSSSYFSIFHFEDFSLVAPPRYFSIISKLVISYSFEVVNFSEDFINEILLLSSRTYEQLLFFRQFFGQKASILKQFQDCLQSFEPIHLKLSGSNSPSFFFVEFTKGIQVRPNILPSYLIFSLKILRQFPYGKPFSTYAALRFAKLLIHEFYRLPCSQPIEEYNKVDYSPNHRLNI